MIGLELLIRPTLALGFLSVGIAFSVILTGTKGCVPLGSVAFDTTSDAKERPSITGEYGIPARSSKVGAMSMDKTGICSVCFAVIFGPRIQNGTLESKCVFHQMSHMK